MISPIYALGNSTVHTWWWGSLSCFFTLKFLTMNTWGQGGGNYSFRYILGHLYEYLWEVHARRNRALDLKFGFLSSGGGDTPTQPSQLSFMYLGHSHQWKPSLCPPNYKKPVILKLKYKKFIAHWLIFSLLLSNSAFNERDLS